MPPTGEREAAYRLRTMNRRFGWVGLFGAASAFAAAAVLGACGSDDAASSEDGDSGTEGGQPGSDAGIDGSHPLSEAGTDGGGSDGGGDDAQGACTPLQCTPAQGDAGFISACTTTCNHFSTMCTCQANAAAACFCGIGNAAPSCLTGSFAECGGTVPSCNAQLVSDPKNCGRCGHDCGDLACVQGVCQPKRVSLGGTGTINDWASSGTNLYLAMNDGVHVVPIDGLADGGAGVVIPNSSVNGAPIAVSLDDVNVYFTTGGQLGKAAIGGGSPAELMGTSYAGSTDSHPHLLANDAANVYVAPPNGAGSAVFAFPKTGGGPNYLVTLDPNLTNLGPIGVDANRVYYLVTNGLTPELRAVEKAPGHATWAQRIPSDSVEDLVVQTDGVYVAAGRNTGPARQQVPTGGIWRVALDGKSAPAVVLDHSLYLGVVAGLTAEGADLFWIPDSSPGYVYTMPRAAGGSAQRIALADSSYIPRALLVDAKNVYWRDNSMNIRTLPRAYRP
jgi:hypothetical protein